MLATCLRGRVDEGGAVEAPAIEAAGPWVLGHSGARLDGTTVAAPPIFRVSRVLLVHPERTGTEFRGRQQAPIQGAAS